MTYTPADVRRGISGILVERAAAVLPETTTTAYFTITGTVQITGLYAVITTVFSGTAVDLDVVHVPSSPGTVNLTLASAKTCTSFAAGTYLGVEGDGTALVGVTGVAAYLGMVTQPVLGPGSISLHTTATNTGATRWVLTYVPLESGSTVVAA